MQYDLAICRFGGLANFRSPAEGQALAKLRPEATLEAIFAQQRAAITPLREYQDALLAIERSIGAKFEQRPERQEADPDYSIFSMPPAVDIPFDDDGEQSTHLVGLLPSEHARMMLGKREWSFRARASVTACALEVANGLPKVWWTFEGVPSDPAPDNRPTKDEVIEFLTFVRHLETPALDHLSAAYFRALNLVLNREFDFAPELGEDRVRIRFADNNGAAYEALIDALRYRGLDIPAIADSSLGRLDSAKKGVAEFRDFVHESNDPEERIGIDPDTAYVNKTIRITGVDAVVARHECPKSQSVWIAGIAQRPGSRTALDNLELVREQRIAENDDKHLRFFSAARRLTGHFAGIEALRLEQKRRHPDQTIAPII